MAARLLFTSDFGIKLLVFWVSSIITVMVEAVYFLFWKFVILTLVFLKGVEDRFRMKLNISCFCPFYAINIMKEQRCWR